MLRAAAIAWFCAFCQVSKRRRRPSSGIDMVGHVAGGPDMRIIGAAELVDPQAVLDLQAGRRRHLRVGDHAAADDRQVAVAAAAVATDHAATASARLRSARGIAAGENLGPACAMQVGKMGADLRPDDAGHQAIGDFDHRDGAAAGDGRRRDLEADESAADHDQTPPCHQSLPQGERVRDVTQIENRRIALAGQVEAARSGACGQQQAVVADARAVLQLDLATLSIKGNGGAARTETPPSARSASPAWSATPTAARPRLSGFAWRAAGARRAGGARYRRARSGRHSHACAAYGRPSSRLGRRRR